MTNSERTDKVIAFIGSLSDDEYSEYIKASNEDRRSMLREYLDKTTLNPQLEA